MKIEYDSNIKVSCIDLEIGEIYQFATRNKIFIGIPVFDKFSELYTIVDLTNAEIISKKVKHFNDLIKGFRTIIPLEAVLRIEKK